MGMDEAKCVTSSSSFRKEKEQRVIIYVLCSCDVQHVKNWSMEPFAINRPVAEAGI